jgi:hypothetical protein
MRRSRRLYSFWAEMSGLIEGAEGLVDRCAGVGEVDLVEVDPVGVEAAERVVDGLHDVTAGGAFG